MKGAYRIILHLLMAFTLLSYAACSDSDGDELRRIDGLCEISPKKAMSALKKIDRESLSEVNRHYYDMLRIKSADKAYVRHDSDSLIRQVIDYYEEHQSSEHYSEALYYGGRVYSDLGDYPTALRYYHAALEKLPEDKENKRKRGNILIQTGFLLDRMRLCDQAIPYMEENLGILRELKDSLNMADQLQYLGFTYLRKKNYDKARRMFLESKQIADGKYESLSAMGDMYLAEICFLKGNHVDALTNIRGVPAKIKGNYHPKALAYAADIYLQNGVIDTAYMYADSLIRYPHSNNCYRGYEILLHDPVRELVPPDSLPVYYDRYASLVEKEKNSNTDELGLLQTSVYNYSLHEKERVKAEKEKNKTLKWLIAICIAVALCIIIILYLRYNSKRQALDLMIAVRQIDALREELRESNARKEKKIIESDSWPRTSLKKSMKINPDEVRTNESVEDGKKPIEYGGKFYYSPEQELIDKLLKLLEQKNELEPLPEAVYRSEVYSVISEKIRNHKNIPDQSEIWEDLTKLVDTCFPHFNEHLRLLTRGNILETEQRLAMLVKCGFEPRDLKHLFGITKGGVSSRRTRFGIKFFGRKLATDDVDKLIRLL